MAQRWLFAVHIPPLSELEAKEIAHWAKYLQYEHEDTNLDLQYPYKSWAWWLVPAVQCGGCRDRRIPGLAS